MTATLNLGELAERTDTTMRTIRLWISQGLVPGSRGKGPKASYDEEHVERILFVRRLRRALPKGYHLRSLAGWVDGLPREQIRRVAMGEEEVQALELPASELPRAVADSRHPGRDPHPGWTRIELTPDIELRVRGRDPESVHRLALLAMKAKEWLREESGDDEQDPPHPSKQA